MFQKLQKFLGHGERLSRADEQQLDNFLAELTPRLSSGDSDHEAFLKTYCGQQLELTREASQLIFSSSEIVGVSDEVLVDCWKYFEENRRLARRHTPYRHRSPRISKVLSTHRFDFKTVKLLGTMGALFGSFLRDSIRSLEWGIGHPNDIVNAGYPVLGDFPGDITRMNPTRVLVTIANRHADDNCPDALLQLHRRWAG